MYHPKYIVPSEEIARWFWGHLPEDERHANLDFLLDIADGLREGGTWIYPEMGVELILEKKEPDEDGFIWWSIKQSPLCEGYAVNYDGERMYIILQDQIEEVQARNSMPEDSVIIPINSAALGELYAVISLDALLAGINPVACIHEYCLDHNLYQTKH